MNKVLLSLLTVAGVGVLAFGATQAFFSDTETSTGNVLQAGSIDLTVTGNFTSPANGSTGNFVFPQGSVNGLFAFTDLKPGDTGTGKVTINATSNPYWACVGLTNLEDNENLIVDPEAEAGDTTADNGELDNFLRVAVWKDTDNDGVYDGGETQLAGSPFLASSLSTTPWLPLADSTGSGPLGNTALTPATPYSIGMSYCFGTFDTNLVCSSGINPLHNQAQTDSLKGDLEFYAVQSRNNGAFTCSSLNVSPTVTVVPTTTTVTPSVTVQPTNTPAPLVTQS